MQELLKTHVVVLGMCEPQTAENYGIPVYTREYNVALNTYCILL